LVVSRLRQGERTDAEMAATAGAPAPARGATLATSLRDDPEVAAALDELETERRGVVAQIARRRRLFVPLGLALGGVGAWWILTSPSVWKSQHPVLGAAVVIIIAVVVALFLAEMTGGARAWREAFKRRLVPALLARFGAFDVALGVNPDMASLAGAADLLPDVTPGKCQIEDTITGVYRGRAVRIDEYRLFGHDQKGRIDTSKFDCAGLVLATSAERAWPGRLVVTGMASGGERWPAPAGLERVHLEDPDFEAVYRTWSNDQIVARAALTPRMMQAMLGVVDDAGFLPPMLSIDGARVVLFAPFLTASDGFMEPEATQAEALGQAALQLETLALLFDILDMLFESQRLHMTAGPFGETTP